MASPPIGIDLGTTFSCVGVIQDGEVQIVANTDGFRTMPSYVSFKNLSSATEDEDFEILVGASAKDNAGFDPENTIFCAKRLIGRSYDDPVVQDDIKLWPFKIIDDDGRPKYEVQMGEEAKTLYPEEISAKILERLKMDAEDFLGEEVFDAVITVPAYFNENQKNCTRDAAKLAKLNVIELLTEPNAAAIAYGVDMQEGAERTVLVFDFGGGTFDVSILSISDGEFRVQAVGGDSHLGGEDIDNNLAKYFEEQFNRKHNTNLSSNPKAWRRLKAQCEKIKIQLSQVLIANIRLDSLHEGKDLNASLTRARFEEINGEIFERTIGIVKGVVKESKLKNVQIHDVLLVGGSTGIPKVRSLLSQCLGRETALKDILNPDEAVAMGAAILAGVKQNVFLERVEYIKLWDVLPQSLGIGTPRGLMHTFVKRNTRVPVKETMIFSTDKDNQTIVRFKVFEGEFTDTKKNYFLGDFRVAGIPPAPRGVPLIEVTFSVDEDCMLQVTAKELSTKRQRGIQLQHDTKRLTEDELKELLEKAESIAANDKEVRVRTKALSDLEDYCKEIRNACISEPIRSLAPAAISECITKIYKWIDEWHDRKSYPKTEKCAEWRKELEDLWVPFITHFYEGKRIQRDNPPSMFTV